MLRKREAAIAASEQTCPRCGTGREPGQEYCIECGLRLPPVTGRLAALRRAWLRRVGWYPGDWVWISLLALIGAGAGAAVAIALSSDRSGPGGTTVVARGSAPVISRVASPSTTKPAAVPTAPEPTVTVTRPGKTATTPGRPNGRFAWPAGQNGWTIVLISYPTRGGRAAPQATAIRAAGLGLPEVGLLESSEFPSLHPGYYVVFSGLYSSRSDAEAALTSAHASGFGGAYTRQISR